MGLMIFGMVVMWVLLILALYLYAKEKAMSALVDAENNTVVNAILKSKAQLEGRLDESQERIKELNFALKEGYGVNAEVVIKEVTLKFSPAERILILEAIEKLIESGGSIDRVRSLLPLLDKTYKVFLEANEIDAKNDIQKANNERAGTK